MDSLGQQNKIPSHRPSWRLVWRQFLAAGWSRTISRFPMKQRNEPILVNEAPSAPRAALYMRVSTGRQAEHDLSIPDQRAQLQSWCSRQGYEVVAEFVEAGASATDDRRPVFQQMIERACDGEQAFGFIVVHSYSRFF